MIDERTAEQIVIDALRAARPTVFCARGGSMHPSIRSGARVRIEPGRVEVGDIAAVRRPDGGLALHRVIRVRPDGRVETWGDALSSADDWGPSEALGRVVPLDRPGPIDRLRVALRLGLRRVRRRSRPRPS